MKNYLAILALAALVMTMFSSCSKGGCNNEDAINYDSSAKRDDGSCVYEGDVVVWYGESTSQDLIADGVTSLTFYVDGEIEGSAASSVFWTSEPNCGQSGSWSVSLRLGGNSSQLLSYEVVDQDDNSLWSGNLDFQANTCTSYKLTL